jgi:hypothetical protein
MHLKKNFPVVKNHLKKKHKIIYFTPTFLSFAAGETKKNNTCFIPNYFDDKRRGCLLSKPGMPL